MTNINFNNLNENLNTSCNKIVRYGNYTEEYTESNELKTKVNKSISIEDFYKLYLELNNVIGFRRMGSEIVNMKLSSTPMNLLIHLMMKDDDYTIVFRNKDATLTKIGKEINKSPSSVYSTLSKLRKAGYILKDEDELLIFNKELRDLISIVRNHIINDKPLKFDFLFKFCVLKKD